MDTGKEPNQIGIAYINDKSLILDAISKDLFNSGIKVLFKSENIENGIAQLSSLKELPKVCIIDLDFYNNNVLVQLQKLRTKYTNVKLIAHSDIDAEETVKALLKIGFDGYLLIDSDADDLKKAIEGVYNGKRYFSVGVTKIAREYFSNN